MKHRVGVENLQAAHQEQRDAEHIDPMGQPHEQAVPIDQFLAAFGLSCRAAGPLVRNIERHLISHASNRPSISWPSINWTVASYHTPFHLGMAPFHSRIALLRRHKLRQIFRIRNISLPDTRAWPLGTSLTESFIRKMPSKW